MKDLKTFVFEHRGDSIDDQWIQDENPVMTKDGRQVIVTKVNYEEVPNIISGEVKMGTKTFKYEWDDTGMCTKALDKMGNPKKPEDSDTLVKAN